MSFLRYSKKILNPLEIYNLIENSEVIAELKSYNIVFNEVLKKIADLACFFSLREEKVLETLELMIFNKILWGKNIKSRQNNIKTALGLTNSSFKKTDIENLLAVYDITAQIREDYQENKLTFSNIFYKDQPKNLRDVFLEVTKVIPINIVIGYDNGKYSWKDIDDFSRNFKEFDNRNLRWRDFTWEEKNNEQQL